MTGARITREQHAQIEILHDEGYSTRQIAVRLGLIQSTVVRSLKNTQECNDYGYKKPTGRKRCTSFRMDKAIKIASKRSPMKSAAAIRVCFSSDELNIPSARTVSRRLSEAGLKSFRPAKKPLLSSKNVKDRIDFCKKYESFTEEDWCHVMFSDESMISQFSAFTRHVRRPANTRNKSRYCISKVKNAAKIMVWGAISASGRCGLWMMPEGTTINGHVYLDVLKDKLLPFMEIRGCTHFQHDGAPCHRTKTVASWLHQNNVQVLGPWPGNSPDLNPIENCWVHLKKKVAEKNPTSLPDLKRIIVEVWTQEITSELCRSLITSMPRRIQAVLQNKGHHSKY